MPNFFYLATHKDRAAHGAELVRALQAKGWERTFDWSKWVHDPVDRYAELAIAELEGVREADVLIALLPAGYGTHVEIGAALALGKLVILHAPDQKTLETPYPCAFHHHPAVKLLVSKELDIPEVLAAIDAAVGIRDADGKSSTA